MVIWPFRSSHWRIRKNPYFQRTTIFCQIRGRFANSNDLHMLPRDKWIKGWGWSIYGQSLRTSSHSDVKFDRWFKSKSVRLTLQTIAWYSNRYPNEPHYDLSEGLLRYRIQVWGIGCSFGLSIRYQTFRKMIKSIIIIFKTYLMASVALRAFSSIASRAPAVFRSIWSAVKASPTLSSIKDAVIGEFIGKGIKMMDEKTSKSDESIRNVWDVARTGILANSIMNGFPKKTLSYRIKKIWIHKMIIYLCLAYFSNCFPFWNCVSNVFRLVIPFTFWFTL